MSADAAWKMVLREAERLRTVHLRDLFGADDQRFRNLSFCLDDLVLDLSKEKIDADALAALLELARATNVTGQRDAMFAGASVNWTEKRAALHMALRGGAAAPEGDDVDAETARFLVFAGEVRQGDYDDVINLGIGGSDLGPAMAVRALAPDHDGPRVHFVSNLDGAHLADTLKHLDPARTLVIVASKSFTTLETMTNARAARAWLGSHAAANMAAVSTNIDACAEFGIDAERVFGFHDWVGGRYSLWSAIGLPLAIAVGPAKFREMLAGAAAMDRHFMDAPAASNLPVLLGLIGVWRRNAMGWPAVALIPYDQRLARFPAHIQQLEMESNGKRTDRDGRTLERSTAPVIWGEPGSNAQHSFFQMLHQGTDVIPADFIISAEPRDAPADQHEMLVASCLAQSAALAFGRAGGDDLPPHRAFPGDRPSTTILQRRLDAFSLGRLLALYEHKVFVMGAIWGINSFDQFGVELGKDMADRLVPAVRNGQMGGLDSSTAGLIARMRDLRS